MRKLIYSMGVSLDGLIAGPDFPAWTRGSSWIWSRHRRLALASPMFATGVCDSGQDDGGDPTAAALGLRRKAEPEAGGAAAQRFPTTISVLPSGSRNQNSGGTGSPMRLTSGSTSTPPAFRSAWSASMSSV